MGEHRSLITLMKAVQTHVLVEGDEIYGERDFGALTFSRVKIFWKIDYYNRAKRYLSPDPADPNMMLAEMILLHLGMKLDEIQFDLIKRILLGGQENEGYWTSAWSNYERQPQNEEAATTVLNRLKPAVQLLLQMGEAQLM